MKRVSAAVFFWLLVFLPLLIPFSFSEDVDIATLERMAERVDWLSNVEARDYADIYFSLARAYMDLGRKDDAIAALKKGLRVRSWDYGNQLVLAELEIEKGDIAQAVDRLNFVLNNCNDDDIALAAGELLNSPQAQSYKEDIKPRPVLLDHKLYIASFSDASPVIVEAIASRISQEFGIQVEVVERTIALDPSKKRNRFFQRLRLKIAQVLSFHSPQEQKRLASFEKHLQDQYNAKVLMKQVVREYRRELSQPKVLGILGVSGSDIYEKDFNYLFGWAMKGVGVMSYARFYDENTSLDTVIKRAVMQSFSSAGTIIGIERCTTPTCARAYPHSLQEHDRKEDRLCAICLENLRENYRQRKEPLDKQ